MNSKSQSLPSNTKANRTRSTLQADGRLLIQHLSSRQVNIQGGPPTTPLAAVTVGEVMTPNVLCVSPDIEVQSLMALLVERGISGVPVVNERGLPIGMVSKTDIVRHLYEDCAEVSDGETAGDLMLPLAFTLLEGAPLSHAAALMAWEGVHRIPICSDAGDVVGILSALDVVRWLSREEGYPVRRAGTVSAPLVDGVPEAQVDDAQTMHLAAAPRSPCGDVAGNAGCLEWHDSCEDGGHAQDQQGSGRR